MVDLSINYLGLQLRNPVVVGSSGLTDTCEKVIELEKAGAGAVVLKSLFEEEIIFEMEQQVKDMERNHNTFPENYAFWYDEDEEDSIRKYIRLIKECKEAVDIPIIASVNCISAQKWTYLAEQIESAGADAIELNIFLLPSDFKLTAEAYRNMIFNIIEQVRSHAELPISVKLSNYSSELAHLIKQLDKRDIRGVTLFNRSCALDYDINEMKQTTGNILSQSTDYTLPLRWCAILSPRINMSIAASTGIHTGESLIKMLLAGADCVHMVSVFYKKGICEINNIAKELTDWMEKHKFKSIADFKGLMTIAEGKEPADYERVQFYRNFRGYHYKEN